MTDKPPSDEELAAKERRAYRISMAWAIGTPLAWAIILFGCFWLINAGILPKRITLPLALAVPPLGVLVFLVAFFVMRNRTPREAHSEEFLARHSDEMLARWRLLYPIFWLVLIQFAWDQARGSADAGRAGTIAFTAFFVASITCFGPGWARGRMRRAFGDELITALRRRAGFTGYLGVMLLLGLSSVVAFYRPAWAPQLILWMLVIGAVVPQLFYLVLEVRAERDG
jgi:hypothetical protein